MKIQLASKLIVALLVIFVSACEKDATKNPAEQSNSFTIKMTDAPANYAALQVEIERVEAYLQGSGWVQLNSESQVVSVLDLTNGREITIAHQSGLQSGLYTALALYIGDNNTIVVDQNGNEAEIDVEGNGRIEIAIHQEIDAESDASVLLDFNVAASVIQSASGDFSLEPEITPVVDTETGVQGRLSLAATGMISLEGANGEIAYSAFSDASGAFLIRGVSAGTYDVLVHVTGQGSGVPGIDLPGGGPLDIRLDNVTVADGQITQMGTIQL